MYSNHGNRELHKTIDSHAQVWNHFVALCRRYYAIYDKYPGKKVPDAPPDKVEKALPLCSLESCLPSQSLQDVIDRLDKAYTQMFADRKSGKRSSLSPLSRSALDSTSPTPSNKRGGNYYRVTIFVSASGYTAILRVKTYLAPPNGVRLSVTALEMSG